MAAVPQSVNIGGVEYEIILSSNALRLIEHELGIKFSTLATIFLAGNGQLRHYQILLWAMLEGSRRKRGTRPNPYTLDEVGDLLDHEGGSYVVFSNLEHPIPKAIMEAWKSAMPQQKRPEPEVSPNAQAAPSSLGTTA